MPSMCRRRRRSANAASAGGAGSGIENTSSASGAPPPPARRRRARPRRHRRTAPRPRNGCRARGGRRCGRRAPRPGRARAARPAAAGRRAGWTEPPGSATSTAASTVRQRGRAGHLVHDRQGRVDAVADQHRVVAADDRAADVPAAGARVAQRRGRLLEVLVLHDRDRRAGRRACQRRQPPQQANADAETGRRRAGGHRDGRPPEVELLVVRPLDQRRLDRSQLGEQQPGYRLAQPPRSPVDELAHAGGAGERSLRARSRGAQDEQELRRPAGRDAGEGDLRGGVADVHAGDDHVTRPRRR